MKITIESPGIRISQKLQRLIHTKFSRFEKRCDRIVNCDVVLKKEKDNKQKYFTAEARLLIPQKLVFATEKAVTFETAIDKLIDDLEHQLQRRKEALQEVR